MQIKYSKKKQELRSDPVMDSLAKGGRFLQENGNRVLIGVVALAAVVIGSVAFRHFREQTLNKAQQVFGMAMMTYQSDTTAALSQFQALAESHSGVPQAAYAAFMVGEIFLNQGAYDKAVPWFEDAARKGPDLIAGKAYEALGACYEAKGDNQEALAQYEKALNNKKMAFRYPAIRWKMALISKEAGKLDQSRALCEQLVSDTLAGDYVRKAKNLLVELRI